MDYFYFLFEGSRKHKISLVRYSLHVYIFFSAGGRTDMPEHIDNYDMKLSTAEDFMLSLPM